MQWPFSGRTGELRRALRQLAGPTGRGVVIAGPPYVGRTRFLDALAERLPSGTAVARATATRGLREIPFSCLGSYAPSSTDDPSRWLDELVERCGGDRSVLLLDDAQWSDESTGQLLVEAARSGRLHLAVAVRTGHRTPQAVTALWKDSLLERIDLAPLTRREVDELIAGVLGGHVSQAVHHELWDLSRGYPLVLREYLEGGVADGILVEEDGVWVAARDLEPSQRYIDLIRHLLADVPPEVAEAMHLIALGEPLEVDILDQLTSPEVVAGLERTNIVTQDPSTGRYRITIRGAREALRAALEPATMRRLSKRLSSTMLDQELHDDDLVRLAIWRLDAGDTTDNSLFVRAAERAASSFDHDLTERLARAALPGGGAEARILLANALIHQHRPEEAEEHLAEAARDVATDVDRARVAGVRSRLLFFRLGRMDDGIEVLERACDEVSDPEVVDQLRGSLALLVSMRGDLDHAIGLCDLVLDRPDASRSAKVVAAMSAVFAKVLRGDLEDAVEVGEQALAIPTPGVERDYPMARPTIRLLLMLAEGYLGDLDAAEDRARRGLQQAIERGADAVAGMWGSQLSGLLLWRGDVEQSLRLCAESRRYLAPSDPLGIHALAYAIGAHAAAEAGDARQARHLLEGLRDVRTLVDVRGRLLEQRATAMVRAAAGELDAAEELLVESVGYGVEHEHWTWATFNAYHAVRLGRPERVADVLSEGARRCGGRLVPAVARHGRALLDEDLTELDAAARELAAVGTVLWAAEAYAQGSRIAAARGDRSQASLLRSRAAALVQRCPGASTPALAGLRVTPLTRREHEIALLAAAGRTSREIAEQLVVSVRTVDNHLASVYRKLDIAGRDELPAALAVDLSP